MSNLELTAAIEPQAMLEQLQRRLDRPVTVADLLNPKLVLDGIDFGMIDRAAAAINQLKKDGVTTIRNPRPPNDLMTLDAATFVLEEAKTLAQQFKTLRATK